MIWFLTRGRQQVDVEVRRALDGEGYELVLDYADGTERVERIRDPRRLVERTLRVQHRLIRQGFEPTSPMFPYASASTRPKTRSRRAALWLAFRASVKKRLAASLGL
ncbi:MAG: hypothetical protein ACRD1S_07585 [Vicinamibacterales bacterium]